MLFVVATNSTGVRKMTTFGICFHVTAFQILVLLTVLNIQNILWTGWCAGASSLILICMCYGRNIRGFAIGISTIVFVGFIYAIINWLRWNAMLSAVRIPPVLLVSQVVLTLCSLVAMSPSGVRLENVRSHRYHIRDLFAYTAIVAIVVALFRFPASFAQTAYSVLAVAIAQISVVVVLARAWQQYKHFAKTNDGQRGCTSVAVPVQLAKQSTPATR